MLGFPSKREEVTKVNVKSDEYSEAILLSLQNQRDTKRLLDYSTRAVFFAESDAAKHKALSQRNYILSHLVFVFPLWLSSYIKSHPLLVAHLAVSLFPKNSLTCFRAEPPNVSDVSEGNKENPDGNMASCQLLACPNGIVRLKNTGNKRGWTLEVTQDVSVGKAWFFVPLPEQLCWNLV